MSDLTYGVGHKQPICNAFRFTQDYQKIIDLYIINPMNKWLDQLLPTISACLHYP